MTDLSGLGVLTVRPARDNDPFEAALQDRGCRIFSLPVMAIVPDNDNPDTRAAILDFDHYHKAIFVSRNAALLVLDWLDTYWPQLPLGIRYFAVGESTADILEDADLDVQFPEGNPTSEGLLALPALQPVAGERIVIFRGRGGRDDIRDELTRRGASVDYCELYHREPIRQNRDAIRNRLSSGQIHLVAAHSGEVLQNLLQLLTGEDLARLKRTPVLVPGDRVAAIAREACMEQVIAADSALPDSMVQALGHWYTSGTTGTDS